MKIKATVFCIDIIPQSDEDIELLKSLVDKLNICGSDYDDYELLEDNTLSFQI